MSPKGAKLLVAALVAASTVVGGAAVAGKPGADARCWVEPLSVVAGERGEIWADGLPTKGALNLFVTDANGTVGVPIGQRSDGKVEGRSWLFASPGLTVIQVTGRTKKNMNTMKVYAECSVDVLAP